MPHQAVQIVPLVTISRLQSHHLVHTAAPRDFIVQVGQQLIFRVQQVSMRGQVSQLVSLVRVVSILGQRSHPALQAAHLAGTMRTSQVVKPARYVASADIRQASLQLAVR